jgi:hypothetical protein
VLGGRGRGETGAAAVAGSMTDTLCVRRRQCGGERDGVGPRNGTHTNIAVLCNKDT